MAKGGKKSSLKSTLQSQQSRLKLNQKIKQAAQVSEQNRKKNPGQKSNNRGKGKSPLRTTNPFNTTDRILLIGEGNFSFARALLSTIPSSNITATTYDSEEECYKKYPEAETIVQDLREKGVEVIFEVDGTRLEKVGGWKGGKRMWDRVVWNFPHAGKGIADQDRNILTNQTLILGFLRSVKPFLATGSIPQLNTARKRKPNPDDDDEEEEEEMREGSGLGGTGSKESRRGTILITLRNVAPYTQWDVPRLAKKPPTPTPPNTKSNPIYTLLRSFVFHRGMWEGYEHRMTKGERAHGLGKTGEGGEDRTWEFCLADL